MSGFDWFGLRGNHNKGSAYLPEIFPMPVPFAEFVRIDVESIYSKILTDVIERTQGIPEDAETVLWDNCLQSETSHGLITHLARSMEQKSELFLVYANSVLRKATNQEQEQIKLDYKATGESKIGIFVSFAHYRKTDMVRLYSGLEYWAVSSLHKSMNLSKAIQYKVNDLRAAVSLIDKDNAQGQAQRMAEALSKGKDVYMDAKDLIASHQPDLDATNQSIEFIDSKRCFYLGLPLCYINGEQSGGLGDTGKSDSKAIERGLKNYFNSIIKPVLEALFPEADIEYKSQDFDMVDSAINALKTFELTDDRFVSGQEKRLIMVKMLDLDPESDIAPDPDLIANGPPPPPPPVIVQNGQPQPGQVPPPNKVPQP